MVEAARQNATFVAMAAKFRFCRDLQVASELIVDGSLGSIRLVENAFTSRIDMSNRWNSDPAMSGGGVIIDNGTHSVDLIGWLCGPIIEVLATEQARPYGFEVEDTARLQLVTELGIDATVDLSWSIDKSLGDFLRVYGTDRRVAGGLAILGDGAASGTTGRSSVRATRSSTRWPAPSPSSAGRCTASSRRRSMVLRACSRPL